jgi:hypothetical protein
VPEVWAGQDLLELSHVQQLEDGRGLHQYLKVLNDEHPEEIIYFKHLIQRGKRECIEGGTQCLPEVKNLRYFLMFNSSTRGVNIITGLACGDLTCHDLT